MSNICNSLGKHKNLECTDTEKEEGRSGSQWKWMDLKHAEGSNINRMQKRKRIKNTNLVEKELGNLLNEVQTDNLITWEIKFETPSTQSLNF